MTVFADLAEDEYRSKLGYRADLKPLAAANAAPFPYADTAPAKEVRSCGEELPRGVEK